MAHKKTHILYLLLCCAALAACTSSSHDGGDTCRPTMAVSIEPQHYLLQRIVGDSINIVTMLPPDADPENYEPPIKLLRELNNSSVYFAIGNMPFESSLLERSGIAARGVRIITADSLQTIAGTHHHDGAHKHETFDPHVWTSIDNCRKMSQQMLDAVLLADPANDTYYRNRFASLQHSLDSLDNAIASRLAPCRGDMIIVEHPSLSYFARDYGLKQLCFGADNKEITPNRLRQVIDSAGSANRAVTMVSEAAYNAARTQAIALQAQASGASINTLGRDFLQQLDTLSVILSQSHHDQPSR